jgi:hypothetical protein
MYSLISILIIFFSSLKSSFASDFAVSVFQTQVGPRNKKLQSGFHSLASPALALLIAFETLIIALSCHITDFFKTSSSFKSFSFSVSRSFCAGIQVHFATTSAISLLSTLSFKYTTPVS